LESHQTAQLWVRFVSARNALQTGSLGVWSALSIRHIEEEKTESRTTLRAPLTELLIP
jgi:hypothetical protein